MSDTTEMPKILCEADLLKQFGGKSKALDMLKTVLKPGSSKTMNEAIKDIKVLSMMKHPFVFSLCSVRYEKRAIGQADISIRKGRESAKMRPKSADYTEKQAWAMEFDPVDPSTQETSRLYFRESYYSYPCDACGTKGSYQCNCNYGFTRCIECGGSGGSRCRVCNNGYVQCSSCYGHGYIDDYDIYRDCYVSIKCSSCYGTGSVTCYTCGGKGRVNCYNCGGRGKAVCIKCGGTYLAVCNKCQGNGQRATQVYVEQSFATYTCMNALIAPKIDLKHYGTKVRSVQGKADTDTLLGRSESSEPITEVSSKTLGKYKFDVSGYMQSTIKNLDSKRLNKKYYYICEIYSREFITISFEICGEQIDVLWEPTYGSYYFSKNPFKPVTDKLNAELAEAEAKGKKHKIKNLQEELATIAREYH